MSQHETIKPELEAYATSIEGLRQTGHQFWTRGWSLGTSSNYSAVVGREPLRLLVTASGKDKGHLGPNDFVVCDELGKPAFENQPKSSAETLLHCLAAKRGAGAILHTHSVWCTLLSEHFSQYFAEHPEEPCWGYLIRRHGMYTWGKDIAEARRHIEILEFLLECLGRSTKLV